MDNYDYFVLTLIISKILYQKNVNNVNNNDNLMFIVNNNYISIMDSINSYNYSIYNNNTINLWYEQCKSIYITIPQPPFNKVYNPIVKENFKKEIVDRTIYMLIHNNTTKNARYNNDNSKVNICCEYNEIIINFVYEVITFLLTNDKNSYTNLLYNGITGFDIYYKAYDNITKNVTNIENIFNSIDSTRIIYEMDKLYNINDNLPEYNHDTYKLIYNDYNRKSKLLLDLIKNDKTVFYYIIEINEINERNYINANYSDIDLFNPYQCNDNNLDTNLYALLLNYCLYMHIDYLLHKTKLKKQHLFKSIRNEILNLNLPENITNELKFLKNNDVPIYNDYIPFVEHRPSIDYEETINSYNVDFMMGYIDNIDITTYQLILGIFKKCYKGTYT